MSTLESCVVALYRERNSATDTLQNATNDATETQPHSLKALAMQVLERNQRNQTRNSSAISRLRYPENSATQNNNSATSSITAILEKYGLTIEEIIQTAGEDWKDIKNNLPAINALAALIMDGHLRAEGKVPPAYNAQAHCQGCGNVWLPPALTTVNPILSCPWCFHRASGMVIPKPF